MVIRIIGDYSEDPQVPIDTLIRTIETNRDRCRASANMLLTLAGVVLAASFAYLAFLFEKQPDMTPASVLFTVAAICFLVSAFSSVYSSFLNTEVPIAGQSQFVVDLLRMLHREVRFLRIAGATIVLGLVLLTSGIVVTLF